MELEQPSFHFKPQHDRRPLIPEPLPVKLIVYQGVGGIGHGPSKPKSHRATMEHNIEWFDQYMFATAGKPTSER